MIVFAAITPHTPLLLSSINKEKLNKVAKTREAMASLADELYAAQPDTIVILSSHGTIFDDAFSINLHDEYRVDLAEFGDLATNRTYLPDLKLIDTLQRTLRRKQHPVTLSSDGKLDYGASVPLLLLTEHLPKIKIIPISFSGLTSKEHFQFGDALKDALMNSTSRVAIIATGDQSHALETSSPAGFAKEGEAYDILVRECLVNKNSTSLITMDPDDIAKARECSYRPMLMLLGVLEQINNRPIIHSYEAPFGVGYLVVNFELA